MEKVIIGTDQAFAAAGPYEQGIKAGNFLFTTVQVAALPLGVSIETDIMAVDE